MLPGALERVGDGADELAAHGDALHQPQQHEQHGGQHAQYDDALALLLALVAAALRSALIRRQKDDANRRD